MEDSGVKQRWRGFRHWLKSWDLHLRQRINAPTVTSLYGPRFAANYGDLTFQLYIMATYGFFYWKWLSRVSEGFIFLDIGANQGLYSICAARNRHCQRVYAFEPVPFVAGLLRQNLSLNRVGVKCTVVQKAVSDHTGEVEILTKSGHSGVATIAAGNATVTDGQRETIQTMDAAGLDRTIEAGNLPVYVKIDVEGHEEVVIKELLKCAFFGQIREIFYEVDEDWVNPARLQALLAEAGFETEKIGSNRHYDVLAVRRSAV